ncbi:hypothetical protein CaCOL14_010533 [Colletotrichum acutatum]
MLVESSDRATSGNTLATPTCNQLSRPFCRDFNWPQQFSQKPKTAAIPEDRPWANFHEGCNSPKDAISLFLTSDDDDVSYHGRVRAILDACHYLDLHDLPSIESLDGEKRVAWLIDSQLVHGVVRTRDCSGSLTARLLAEVLSKPRYQKCLTSNTREQGDTREMTKWEDTQAFDAERRLLFLTNLDCWSVLAIVKTATLSQTKLLGDFFYKHLNSITTVGVLFEAWGYPIFSLEFHFPFRVWRTSESLLKDERIKSSNNDALRSSRDVTCLLPTGDGDKANQVHGIYSGHIACLVSGHDYWRWTAHSCIDTWFDQDEGINEQVIRYANDMQDGRGCDFDPDPCSGGHDASKLYWHPRIWFLRMFSFRLAQIKDEWESVCFHLGQSLEREDRKYKMLLRNLRHSPGLANTEQHRFQVDALENSMLKSQDILQDLISVIRETVKVGTSFVSTEVNFFLNVDGQPGDATDCYPYLSDIRRRFYELGQLSVRLDSYQAECSSVIQYCQAPKKTPPNFRSTLDERCAVSFHGMLQVQVEIEEMRNQFIQTRLNDGELVSLEPEGVEEIRVLETSTLLMQAFSQTTALFSAEGVIAFAKNWQSFLMSLLVAYGINLSTGTALLLWIRRARRRAQDACASELSRSVLPGFVAPLRRNSTSPHVKSHVLHWIPSIPFFRKAESGISGPPGALQNLGQNIEYIPICLRVDGKRLPKLNDISSQGCNDDKSFFSSFRELLLRDRWFTWSGFLSRSGLREPIGMHYVEFELYNDGYVSIRFRQKVPPISEATRYRPTESPSFEPVPSKRLMDLFKSTADINVSDRSNLDRIIHRIDGQLPLQRKVGIGYGLEIEEGPNYNLLWLIRWTSVVFCVVFGVIWAARTGDIESGFAISTCLIAFSIASVAFLNFAASRGFSDNEETGQHV